MVRLGLARRFLKVVHVPQGRRGTAFVVLGQVGYVAHGIAAGVFSVLRATQARLDDQRARRDRPADRVDRARDEGVR